MDIPFNFLKQHFNFQQPLSSQQEKQPKQNEANAWNKFIFLNAKIFSYMMTSTLSKTVWWKFKFYRLWNNNFIINNYKSV